MKVNIELKKIRQKLFIQILVIIFVVEALVMVVIPYFHLENEILEFLVDSTLLTIISGPFIYYHLVHKLVVANSQLFVDLQRQIDSLNVAALVSETDTKGFIISANKQFCEVSGYSESELVGVSHKIVNSGHHSNQFWQTCWETIKEGNIWREDVCNRAKDGSLYWVDATIFPKKNHHGEVIGYSAVRVDISERQEVKENLKRAKEEAESFGRSKSLFLANMSHEIRTPMNGVLGMNRLLIDSGLSGEQLKMAKTVKSCGDSLLTIINDILDFSKIESDNLELEKIPFNLNTFIDDLCFLFLESTKSKNINMKVNIDSAVPIKLIGDVTRIRQILSNFLSNAIKFTEPEGRVTLTIKNKNIGTEIVELDISVEDTGVGIRKENQGKLFTAFTQADISTTREFGGTGLGLAICAKLVDLMDATIGLESEFGKGTKMSLFVPLEINSKPEIVNDEEYANEQNEGFSLRHQHNILVVEDNVVNQKLAAMMLKKLGYSCDIAANGIEALDALKRQKDHQYTLIFMDMMMPKKDGVTATKEIVTLFEADRPTIVAMTANAFSEDKRKCFEAGMDDFIAKPVDLNEIKRVLSKFSKFPYISERKIG